MSNKKLRIRIDDFKLQTATLRYWEDHASLEIRLLADEAIESAVAQNGGYGLRELRVDTFFSSLESGIGKLIIVKENNKFLCDLISQQVEILNKRLEFQYARLNKDSNQKRMSEEAYEHYSDELAESHNIDMLDEKFNFLIRSAFLNVVFIWEAHVSKAIMALENLCGIKNIESLRSSPIDFKERFCIARKNGGLSKSKYCIEAFEKMQIHHEVRNYLAHSNGNIALRILSNKNKFKLEEMQSYELETELLFGYQIFGAGEDKNKTHEVIDTLMKKCPHLKFKNGDLALSNEYLLFLIENVFSAFVALLNFGLSVPEWPKLAMSEPNHPFGQNQT